MINYYKRTLELAQLGAGWTEPNPLVGALLVRDGRIIGEGHHQKYGGPHAEVNAVEDARRRGETIVGATLYTSLEPCCHTSKQTPPCTSLILQEKIQKVMVLSLDPNPQVAGKGLELLKAQGVQVELGPEDLRKTEERLNEHFRKYIQTSLPFVHLKAAQTLDGKMADLQSDSKWITGELSRAHVHHLRGTHRGLVVGMGTLLKDNPHLNLRFGNEVLYPGPIRIVLGKLSSLGKPDKTRFQMMHDELVEQTYLICTEKCDPNPWREFGLKVYPVPSSENGVDLKAFLKLMGEHKISSLLVEGGPLLHSSFLDLNLVDRLSLFIAPKIMGPGLGSFDHMGARKMKSTIQLKDVEYKNFGTDLFVTGVPL